MKRTVGDLALFGGRPAFREELHVGRPNLGDRSQLLQRINDIFDRRWFTNNGPYVQEFESKVAAIAGVKHCIACCNATIALELVIRALELKGEVIVPSFTFIATAHALQWQEITPVFADIDPATHNVDPGAIESLITPRTSGILATHLWGRPCAIEALQEIAQRRNLILMFDAAHAFGCSFRGRMIGSFGCAEVFSFHATKFLNSFEGGAITTNDDELAVQIRLMKNFGFSGYDNVIHIGTNGKMTEVCAAMGLNNFESLEDFVAVNRRNYSAYRQGLVGIPGLLLLEFNETEKCNYQYIVVEVNNAITRLTRDQLLRVLHAENVLARRYFYPGCHRMEPYRSTMPQAGLWLRNTERIAGRVIVLPTGTAVSPEDITTICKILSLAIKQADLVSSKLESPELK